MGVSVCDHIYVHGGGDFIFVTHILRDVNGAASSGRCQPRGTHALRNWSTECV